MKETTVCRNQHLAAIVLEKWGKKKSGKKSGKNHIAAGGGLGEK